MSKQVTAKVAMLSAAAVLGLLVAFAIVTNAEATGCSKKHPERCDTTTTETTTTPPPTIPWTCPDGKPPEENPVNPNDNCERPKPPPPVETTPPPVTPPPVTPPSAARCEDYGLTPIASDKDKLICAKQVVVIKRVPGKKQVVVKKVRGKTVFLKYCPKPRNGKKLTG